ncbi:hypothetical protein [Chitinimonas sp.]|uniref:hypothetical protein n=1 Tax=Chitinimonas sp. TaxID=1934313 RepID=UPI002F921A5D
MLRPALLATLLTVSALSGIVHAAPGDIGSSRQLAADRGGREQIAPFTHSDRTPPRPGTTDPRPGDSRWDHDGRPGYNGGPHNYPGDRWYGPRPPHVIYRPVYGTHITFLPGGYRTVFYGGLTYFVVDDIFYRREADSYVVVAPPDGYRYVEDDDEGPSGGSGGTDREPYIYPNRNQDDKQQALDRYECHRWAVKQTGFDPTEPGGGVSRGDAWQKRDDYRRAESACLEGRGYTVR